MKIELDTNDFDEKSYCHLCGSTFITKEIVARAYNESGDYITDVCPECIATGSEGISRRMRSRAEHLRALAAQLEKLAWDNIATPTIDQLNTMNQIARALY